MSFIRVKEIGKKNGKKYRYAYLVENKWRKRLKKGTRGSRQKVSKYLGKVVKFEKNEVEEGEDNFPGFFEFLKVEESKVSKYLKKTKNELIRDLVRYELSKLMFSPEIGKDGEKDIMVKAHFRFDVEKMRFIDHNGEVEKIVIEMNEGFLCEQTLKSLARFKLKQDEDDEREAGMRLAKTFLETGLKVPKEIFVAYFEKV